jgi:hypothetical protein
MEINRNAPATAEGELRIDADSQTVFSVISALDQWPSWNPDVLKGYSRRTLDKGIRSVLAHLKAEAERRAATA